MARFYDIAERMKTGREKPSVKLDEGHIYTINTSKSVALYIQGISEDPELNDIEKIDKVILTALGQEALDYINEQELTVAGTMAIANTIMAAIADMDLEEAEAAFKEDAKKPGKKSE